MPELPDTKSLLEGLKFTPELPDTKSLFTGVNLMPELPDTKSLFAGVNLMPEPPDTKSLLEGLKFTPELPDTKSLLEGLKFTPELPDTKTILEGLRVKPAWQVTNDLFDVVNVIPDLMDSGGGSQDVSAVLHRFIDGGDAEILRTGLESTQVSHTSSLCDQLFFRAQFDIRFDLAPVPHSIHLAVSRKWWKFEDGVISG